MMLPELLVLVQELGPSIASEGQFPFLMEVELSDLSHT